MSRLALIVGAGLLAAGCASGNFYKTDLLANDIADFKIVAGSQARVLAVDGVAIHPADEMIRVKEGKHEFKVSCKMEKETVERTIYGRVKAGSKYFLKVDNKELCYLMVHPS